MEPVTKALIETGTLGVLLAGALVVIFALAAAYVRLQNKFDAYRDKHEERDAQIAKENIETTNKTAVALAEMSRATCASLGSLEKRFDDAIRGHT